MRVPDPPKDSFYHIMQTAGETSRELYQTVRAMYKSREDGDLIFDALVNMGDMHDQSGFLDKEESTAMFSWYGAVDYYLRKAPTDIVMSSDLCSQMYLSSIIDVPYGDIEISQPLQFINLANAQLDITVPIVQTMNEALVDNLDEKGHASFRLLGFLVIDLERMGSRIFEYAKMRSREAYLEKKAMYPSYGRDYDHTRYIFLTVLDGAPDPYGPFFPFGERNLKNTDFVRTEVAGLMLGQDMSAMTYDSSEISQLGIALDMALKSLLFMQMGDFNSANVSFGKSLGAMRQASKQKKKKKGGRPPVRRLGDYMVNYVSEKSNVGLPWLPPEEAASLAEEIVENSDDEQIIRTARGEIRIPNHAKLIWVTEEYIERHGITEDEIFDEGMIGRRRPRSEDPNDLIVKQRYLIKKMFTYEKKDTGEGDISNVRARVKRVSSRRRNPLF